MKASLIFFALLLLLNNPCVISQSIYAIPMPVGWPVALAAIIPDSIKLSPNPIFQWSFPNENNKNPLCTVQGQEKAPCVGKVVDHVFQQAGSQDITLTITDSSLSSPITITVSVIIKDHSDYPNIVRAEIRKMQKETWDQYVKGLYILKEVGIYDHLVKIHTMSFGHGRSSGTMRGVAHAGPAFTLWHRAQTRVLELYMQYAIGDSNIGVPYMDWMQTYNGIEKYFGGNGDPNFDWVVTDGAFCNDPRQTSSPTCPKKWPLPADYPAQNKAIQRQMGNDSYFHFQTEDEFNRLMSIDTYDSPPYNERSAARSSFRTSLEGWPTTESGVFTYGYNHNGVHRWMGGTMGQVSLSLHDPFFLSHHANVDRLMTLWQIKWGCDKQNTLPRCYSPQYGDPSLQNGDVAGVQNGRLVGHMYDDTMYPWDLKISELLIVSQKYTYLDPHTEPPALSKTAKVAEPELNNNGTVIRQPAFAASRSTAFRVEYSWQSIAAIAALITLALI